MLPFLKKQRPVAGIVIETRKPDEGKEPEAAGDESGLESAAHDLLMAIEAKDVKAMAAAMKAAFEIMESQPHEEGEHLESEEE